MKFIREILLEATVCATDIGVHVVLVSLVACGLHNK